MKHTETILTITGSDGTGGSGVQADTRTIADMGGWAVSAITSVTMQSSLGIQEFYDLPVTVVEAQIEAVVNDFEPQVVKVGLLRSVEMVNMVVGLLRKYQPRYVVYDPTSRSTRGDVLLSNEVVEAVAARLLPLCTYVVERCDTRAHGHANQLASAVCVFLSRGETPADAVAHAHDYLAQRPAMSAEPQEGRAAVLFRLFAERVGRFCRRYSDVAFYAAELNISSRYLAQVTRRVAGKSPKAIIEEHLVAEIEHEMATGRKPLKLIAHELGFSSPAHLTRFFRKQKGLSPTEYKNKQQQ